MAVSARRRVINADTAMKKALNLIGYSSVWAKNGSHCQYRSETRIGRQIPNNIMRPLINPFNDMNELYNEYSGGYKMAKPVK